MASPSSSGRCCQITNTSQHPVSLISTDVIMGTLPKQWSQWWLWGREGVFTVVQELHLPPHWGGLISVYTFVEGVEQMEVWGWTSFSRKMDRRRSPQGSNP